MRSRGRGLSSLAAALCLFAAGPAFAGTLGEFEKDATRPASGNHPEGHEVPEAVGEALGESLCEPCLLLCGYGGALSLARMQEKATATGEVPRREVGEALIPLLRLDGAYQGVRPDVEAGDLRAEAGYGPVGLEVRYTLYGERSPRDELSLTRAHALYRMSFGDFLEIDLGLGALWLAGERTTSGFSFTLPVSLRPWNFVGLELRPAWADLHGNSLADYDLAVLLGRRHSFVRLGYRWVQSEHESLDGPEAGVTLSW